jgi:ACS family allantoate permease-like MFS transporter
MALRPLYPAVSRQGRVSLAYPPTEEIWKLMPKSSLSYASVMGILTDANLTTHQFTWLGSIYYLGYIAALIPHNRALQYFTPSKYIAACMVLWGIVLTTMVACNSFKALMIQRVFMGTLEAVVNCGFVLVTAAW